MSSHRVSRRLVPALATAGLLAATLAAVACNPPTGITAQVVGNYQLATVNGAALPYLLGGSGADTAQITAGSVKMQSDSTFVLSVSSRSTSAGVVTESTITQDGTWTAAGTTVSFAYTNGAQDAASITDNALTFTESSSSGSLTFVFRR